MNGYTNGAHGVGADGWGSGDGAGDSRGPVGPFPPIAEIIASATDTAESLKHHSVLIQRRLRGNTFMGQSLTITDQTPP